MPSLPSGTFSKDGLPTIVTELVANHVVRLQENGMDPMQHLEQIVEDLDAHLLLPTNPGLTQDIKEDLAILSCDFALLKAIWQAE